MWQLGSTPTTNSRVLWVQQKSRIKSAHLSPSAWTTSSYQENPFFSQQLRTRANASNRSFSLRYKRWNEEALASFPPFPLRRTDLSLIFNAKHNSSLHSLSLSLSLKTYINGTSSGNSTDSKLLTLPHLKILPKPIRQEDQALRVVVQFFDSSPQATKGPQSDSH